MLVTKTFYSVKCDKCGKILDCDPEGDYCGDNDAGGDFEVDECAAYAVAECADWHCEENDYCCDCWKKIEEEMEAENEI